MDKVPSKPQSKVVNTTKLELKPQQLFQPNNEHEEGDKDLTLEDHLAIFKSDNLQMKQSIRNLTDFVQRLQERIKCLEDSNTKTSVNHSAISSDFLH